MKRPILRYGAPVLHRPARPVEAITPEVEQLIHDMIETVHAAPGVGLAANQVGEDVRVCVVDLSVGTRASDLHVLINPEILGQAGMQLHEEGCLSVPGFEASVLRPASVTVRAQDAGGHCREIAADGLLARALQHEIDHLDGILFLDRLRPVYRWSILRRIARRRRAGQW
jgi:peptide deformylase